MITFAFHLRAKTSEFQGYEDFSEKMRVVKALLLICGIQQTLARSHGVRRDEICADVNSETLVIKDDPESCGTFIACIGQVAQRFKCFSDKVYSPQDSLPTCLRCEENVDEYYEDENPYGGGKKTTKKKFTYKQTKKTKPTKKYGQPTRPPTTRYATTPPYTVSEIETTDINNFTISFHSELN